MHTTLTTGDAELRAVLHALQGLQAGTGTVQLPEDWTGTAGEVARLFNQVVARDRSKVRAEAPDRLRRPTCLYDRTAAPLTIRPAASPSLR